jgi:oxygen-independent coproporphyrinogen-3 oxidase
MDHFSLESDDLYQSLIQKSCIVILWAILLAIQLMVGLGMSAISDSWYGFAQNEKTVEDYQKRVEEGKIPVFRGHILNEEDLIIRRHILNLMCQLETTFTDKNTFAELPEALEKLKEMQEDGLVELAKIL